MKKTLLALAVLGMVAGAAQASNVTIYGKLQPSYDMMSVDAKAGGSEDIVTMNSNSSRVGFKGSEDLGNGLKAIFKLETKFDMVNGKGFNGGRDTYVGLKGNFGTVIFGHMDSAYKSATGKYDSFSDTIGDYNMIMGFTGSQKDANNRYARSVKYTTPAMNGFKVMANYSLDTDTGVVQADTTATWGFAASYDNGPLNVVAAYEDNNDLATKFWKIGAAYKIDAFKVKAIYEKAEDTAANQDNKNFLVGVDYKLNGSTKLMANYIVAGDYDTSDSGADALNVGVSYALSKRTSIQGVYSVLDNEANGEYTNRSGFGSAASSKVSGISVRLQHKF